MGFLPPDAGSAPGRYSQARGLFTHLNIAAMKETRIDALLDAKDKSR
jgi:hypothetical protein